MLLLRLRQDWENTLRVLKLRIAGGAFKNPNVQDVLQKHWIRPSEELGSRHQRLMAPRESNALIPVTMPILPKWAHLPRTASSSSSQNPLLRDPGDPCLWEVAGKGGPGKTFRPPNPSSTSRIREAAGADQANTFTTVQILWGEANKKTHSSKGTPLIFFPPT